jgi:hypothetical protein
VFSPDQISQITVVPAQLPYDGNPELFRLGVEAIRLGLAYEYDPYFSLSIARVGPWPHQLEAVYDWYSEAPGAMPCRP